MMIDESKAVLKEKILVYVRMAAWPVARTPGCDSRFPGQDCNQRTRVMLGFSWVPCYLVGLLDLFKSDAGVLCRYH
jgi:hypothetical protein